VFDFFFFSFFTVLTVVFPVQGPRDMGDPYTGKYWLFYSHVFWLGSSLWSK
jgi:hypothetical protein